MFKPEIVNASKQKEKDVSNYLRLSYPDRKKDISSLWKWLYKSNEFNYSSSYIATINNKIVGHAGSIPTKLVMNKKIYNANWFVDFIVDSNIRNLGIGKKLTEKWMQENKLGITFCNDQSARVFKKYGWNETYNSFMHYFFIKPVSHEKFNKYFNKIKIIRNILNSIFKIYFLSYYYIKGSKQKFKIDKLTLENINSYKNNSSNNQKILTLRDSQYLNWKFLKSPEYDFYRIFRNDCSSSIIKIREDKRECHHIDVLLLDYDDNIRNLQKLIADICLWSAKKDFAYVRMHTSDRTFNDIIKNNIFSVIRKNRFLYYCKDKELESLFRNNLFEWTLADSDYDIIS